MSSAGWDCHAHLFGPYERFPLAANRNQTPPEALEPQYLALLARLGLSHGVLVHPSAYGEDHRLLFHALAAHANLRGVIVARPETLRELNGSRHGSRPDKSLLDLGLRGARFSHRSGAGANFPGSASFDDLLASVTILADAGLHAELWTDCKALPDIAARLRELPFPLVIDHMGGFDVAAGIDEPGFRCLLSLLEDGQAWVKLCAYRNLLGVADFELGLPFHQAMLQANPDRLVWGSDWPHLRVTPVPDAAQLLDVLERWTADAALTSRILLTNPAALYA